MAESIIHRLDPVAAEQVRAAHLYWNPLALADFLAGLKGHQFLGYQAIFPEESLKFIKYHRKYPHKCETPVPNPFIGSGIYKYTNAQLTVNFDYQSKRERRGGAEPQYHGSWHCPVLVEGRVTPLAVHKADIICELPEGCKDSVLFYRPVTDAEGNVQFITPEPRLYLRYEIVRDGGDAPRQQRNMRSDSKYLLPKGQAVQLDLPNSETILLRGTVPDSILKPFFEKRKPRNDETDFQVTALDKVIELQAGGEVFRKQTEPVAS